MIMYYYADIKKLKKLQNMALRIKNSQLCRILKKIVITERKDHI